MDRRVIIQTLVIGFAALVQNTSLLTMGGIKINLVIIILFLYIFAAHSFLEYGVYVGVAALALTTEPGWDPAVISFSAVGFLAYALRDIFPWKSWLTYGALLAVGTLFLYALIDWRFIQKTPLLFLQEVVYNLVGGALVYICTARFYGERQGRPF